MLEARERAVHPPEHSADRAEELGRMRTRGGQWNSLDPRQRAEAMRLRVDQIDHEIGARTRGADSGDGERRIDRFDPAERLMLELEQAVFFGRARDLEDDSVAEPGLDREVAVTFARELDRGAAEAPVAVRQRGRLVGAERRPVEHELNRVRAGSAHRLVPTVTVAGSWRQGQDGSNPARSIAASSSSREK